MNEYQSFGFGVNSVALGEMLTCEKVFADTGAEHPSTYEYIGYYLGTGRRVTILSTHVEGVNNIVDWCYKNGHGPLRMYRSCTDKFKIRTVERYIKKPCIINIGIAYDEKHRAKIFEKGEIEYRYPLIDEKITRKGCLEVIEFNGLKTPVKSGCWLCPFQPRKSWERLAREHPALYWKAVQIEELSEKIDLHPKGLRNLWPPPVTLDQALDDGWECQFCFAPIMTDSAQEDRT